MYGRTLLAAAAALLFTATMAPAATPSTRSHGARVERIAAAESGTAQTPKKKHHRKRATKKHHKKPSAGSTQKSN